MFEIKVKNIFNQAKNKIIIDALNITSPFIKTLTKR